MFTSLRSFFIRWGDSNTLSGMAGPPLQVNSLLRDVDRREVWLGPSRTGIGQPGRRSSGSFVTGVEEVWPQRKGHPSPLVGRAPDGHLMAVHLPLWAFRVLSKLSHLDEIDINGGSSMDHVRITRNEDT